jgi:uncharacterized protein (TIRG00374 family)
VVSAALLAAIYFLVDLSELANIFAGLDLAVLSIAVGLLLIVRVVSTSRWSIILTAHAVPSSFLELMKISLISHSIGYMSPGGIGVEVARAYQAGTLYGEVPAAVSSVVIDRVIGLISMLVIAIAIALYLTRSDPEFMQIVWVSVLLLLAIAVFIGTASTKLGRQLVARLPAPPFGRIRPALVRLVENLTNHDRNARLIVPISALSLLMQVFRSLAFWTIFIAVGAEVTLLHCLAFIPLLFVMLSVPVSVGGLGVREGGLAFLFGRVGVGAEECIAAGLVFYALQILFILPGLVIYLVNPSRRPGHA